MCKQYEKERLFWQEKNKNRQSTDKLLPKCTYFIEKDSAWCYNNYSYKEAIIIKSIGEIIREKRLAKGMTQEELGSKVFVSKQVVSKWENGKTLPDIEMIRKLCEILDINKDEILGGSIEDTKKSRKNLKVGIIVSAIIVIISLLFVGVDGFGYIDRHTQSGVAYISVFEDGEVISTSEYQIRELKIEDLKYGHEAKADYGELRGILKYGENEIEFGFVNTNNWHNIQIRLDISHIDGTVTVRQTVSYKTDGAYDVFVNESTASEKTLSVYRRGV